MKIESNKVVKIIYELEIGEENDKELLEIVQDDEPMVFIHGLSGLPEKFEEKLIGLQAEDEFEFSIDAEDGYGEPDPEAIIDFPIDNFKIENGQVPEGMLEIGNIIPFSNEDGGRMNGRIIEIGEDFVVLDFNHPLAGQKMHFKGKILEVRNASQSELDHGHVHGEGGVIH
ncbi:peptidylprolyl isomerase (FKBP-type peptidyl-prolyl cis-trans isomerase) [Emticicia oligotrophica DSM 17448]|uniref:peptidylprolyl isomerase n=1 Tax=Emticicia oligotrophica (strain DSM 17448 / CIP 109782 / MTCC 6937 / GPTSA100-15) TaxID=929562 RepID=A0ABN4AT19_EMTOG|nr:peptidylprolyl isomerase [Emticicia oligotrophica]AFK05300.1 peptidylprolyl isomerase (FKBP-type peptidyl-prolyl cis-trans isomerase) [Emticicia oligotrophica DSM 17448]